MSRRQTNISRTPRQIVADLKEIGPRIREIRGFELTQGAFGRVRSITQAQLSKSELGLSAPTPDIPLRLKAYSGKTIDWSLTGEESKAGSRA